MSPKRLIIILVSFGLLAAVLVGLAAGSGKKHARSVTRSRPTPIKGSAGNPNATRKYWTRERMKNARPAPMGVPGRGSKPSPNSGGGSGQKTGGSQPSQP
jgi:hypothetical protein